MKSSTKLNRAPRAAKKPDAVAVITTPIVSEPAKIEVIAESHAPAIVETLATSSLPTLPEIPAGATHFRLTRKMLEIASDVRHLASDLAALGQRDGDKLEFGTLTANGSFTTNQKALRDPNAPKVTRSKVITGDALALAEKMIREGTHTSKAVTAAVLAQFPGDEKKTKREVSRLGRKLTKSGALTGPAFIKPVRTVKPKATKEEKAAARAAARAAMEYGV